MNEMAITIFSGSMAAHYPENVQDAVLFIFNFIEYSVVVFFIFVMSYYLKGALQPGTRGV